MLIKAGTYRFNDVLTMAEEVFAELHSASNGLDIFEIQGETDGELFVLNYYCLNGNINEQNLVYVSMGMGVYADGWQDEAYKTIIIPTDQEVSAEFYEWFTANAVEQKQISGKWKFNERLSYPAADIRETVSFSDHKGTYVGLVFQLVGSMTYIIDDHAVRAKYNAHSGGFGEEEESRNIDFGTEPQTVSAEFYKWFTANAVSIDAEEEPPIATIQYNGSTISNLFGGQTATLKCKGMKMEDDVVVEVAEVIGGGGSGGGDANIVPLTVTENGVYDTYYEIGTEVWDSNTEYAGSVTVNGITLSFKKAENLIVPNDLNELLDSRYVSVEEVDGDIDHDVLMDYIDITDGIVAVWREFSVLWVKNAAPLNAQYGISFLEDNTVYITNYLQLMYQMYWGAEYMKLSVTAPSKKVENVAYRPVTVEIPIEYTPQEITPTNGYQHLRQVITGKYYADVRVAPVPTQKLEVLSKTEDTTYTPDTGKFFSQVTVKGYDASDITKQHILCGIYFKTLPKTEYKLNEWIDRNDGVLLVQYTDGTTEEISLIDSNASIYGFGTSQVGVRQLTVKYTEGGITSQTVYYITVTE